MHNWQLQDAKAKLSELVKSAITDGPQNITVHGKSAVVVLSRKDYDKLIKPKKSFIKLLRDSPLVGLDLNLKRDKSKNRDVNL